MDISARCDLRWVMGALVGLVVTSGVLAQDATQTLAPASINPVVVADTVPAHDATTGTLVGQAATEGGAATYTVPIVIPPGRAGMQPSVALSYNSRSGDGVMGLGWSLSGLSSIHRCPQTPEQDGVTKGVSYTTGATGDRLCLDGQRLVPSAGTYGTNGTTYSTEINSFARITQVGGSLTGAATCFKVEEKSGRILHYGAVVSGTSCVSPLGRVQPGSVTSTLSWLLVKVEDRVGNNQLYSYTDYNNGEVLLSSITYTGFGSAAGDRSVNFAYVDRGAATPVGAPAAMDIASTYLAGGLTMQTKALSAVTTKIGTATVRTITPTYEASTYSGRLMVAALTECAYSGAISACHPATQFTSSNEGVAVNAPTFHLSSLGSLNLPSSQLPSLRSPEEEVLVAAQRAQRAADAPTTDPSVDRIRLAQLAGDLDGDGTREMAVGINQSDGQHDYLVQLAADRQVRGAVDVTGLLCYSPECYGDFAGDGRSEVVLMPHATSGFIQMAVWTLGRGVIATPGSTPLQLIPTNINVQSSPNLSQFAAPHSADINGDGKLDLVIEQPAASACGTDGGSAKFGVFAYINVTQVDPVTHTISASYPPTFTLPTLPLFCLGRTTPSNGITTFAERIDHIADFNGDGLPDIFVTDILAFNTPSLTQVRLTQVAGGVPSSSAALSCTDIGLTNSAGLDDECQWSRGYALHWMDVNGDGLDDFVIARPNQGVWQVRLNQGGHFSNVVITTTGTGSHAGLDNYHNTGAGADQDQYLFKYAPRVPAMDADGDGKPDLLVVSAQQGFALKMCTFIRLPTQTGGLGCPATGDTINPYCPAYACPQDPGTGAYTMPGPHHPDQIGRWNGNVVFPMYGSRIAEGTDVGPNYTTPDVWYGDTSAYHLAAIKFVQTSASSIEARLSETTLVSSLVGGAADPTSGVSADVFGDGLADLVGNLGCGYEPYELYGTTYPGCLVVDVAGYGPASVTTYATPTATSATTTPASSFAAIYPFYMNQNIGTGLGGGQAALLAPMFTPSVPAPLSVTTTLAAPGLPDLLQSLTDGVGDYASWGYAVLSLPIVQGPLPLYTVPSTNGYTDTRHYYFTSSMPVVSGMTQNNGIGDQFGFRAAVYGYSEAMYNHLGRGFQGFHTISSLTATTDTTRQVQTTTTYNQKFPLTGKVASACSYVPPATPLAASAVCNTTTGPIEVETETDTWICGLSNRAACAQGDSLPVPTGATIYTPLLDTRRVNRFDLATGAAASHTETVNAASATATASGWDANGNLKNQLVTNADDGAGGSFVSSQTVTTTNQYIAADTTTWWLDKLSQNTTATAITYNAAHALPTGATAPPRSVVTGYQWNTDRTPLSQTVQSGVAGQERTIAYGYPTTSYGLPTSVTVSAPSAVPASRATTYTYTKSGTTAAADGYFVLTTTNPAGHLTTTERSTRDGQVSRLIDPNNLKTISTYDVFGRLTQADYQDASGAALYPSRQISLTRCSGGATSTCTGGYGEDTNQAYAAYRMTSVQDGYPTTADWFDALGRRMKHVERGFNGTFIETVTDYDGMNTVAQQSTPFFVNGVPYFTGFTYDRVNRPTLKLSPGAEADPTNGDVVTSYTYTGSKTAIKVRGANVNTGTSCPTTTNLCMDMARYTDVLGHLVKTTQALNGTATYATTKYWYDGSGNPVAAMDAENNLLTASYTAVGQRTDMVDPDAGHWLFTYDGFGELLTQTDARSVQTVHFYDALGRLAQRTATDANASDTSLKVIRDTWSYDPIGTTGGQGLLGYTQRSKGASVSALTQIWKETNSYEPNTKRLSTQTSALDGQTPDWTTSYGYDAWGREALVGYPSGLVQFTLYTSYGQVQGLQNADASHQTWWTHTAEDAWGNVTAETYLGGITGTHQTYASTGQVKQKKWTNGATAVDQWDYGYDSFGNVKSQARTLAGASVGSETFTYDGLQRLGTATYPGATGGTVTYGYTPSGNIDSKSDIAEGPYSYGGNGCGPHGVTGIKAYLSGTNPIFNCDANGNVVNGNTLTAGIYDFRNQPWHIARSGAGEASFAYTSEGERFKESTTTHTTWSGPRGFERSQTTSGTLDRHELGPIVITRQGTTNTVYSQLRDRLGSTVAVRNASGAAYQERTYDAFGMARFGDFTPTVHGVLNMQPVTYRGFTGHEHVDDVWLTHMNGRVYDYQIGRFLSVDPVIQFPANSQSLNPYSYILNNPLAGKDPSGYLIDSRSICFTSPGSCGAIYKTDTASALKALGAGSSRDQPHDGMGSTGATSKPPSGQAADIRDGSRKSTQLAQADPANKEISDEEKEYRELNAPLAKRAKKIADVASKAADVVDEVAIEAANPINYVPVAGVLKKVEKAAEVVNDLRRASKAEDVAVWSATKSRSAVENAFEHWQKHAAEFPEFANSKQYVEAAQSFATNPPASALIKTRGADTLIYDRGTNTFLVRGADGAPRTMFRPTDGINYWDKQ